MPKYPKARQLNLYPSPWRTAEGLGLPASSFMVGRFPGLLAGMSYPRANFPWQKLYDQDIRHVVCLCNREPVYSPTPCKFAYCTDLEDLAGGYTPTDPEKEAIKVKAASEAVLTLLAAKEGVVVHCIGGRGRTGTVLGTVLIKLGMPAGVAITYLNGIYRQYDRGGWPESPWAANYLASLTK